MMKKKPSRWQSFKETVSLSWKAIKGSFCRHEFRLQYEFEGVEYYKCRKCGMKKERQLTN